MPEPDELEWRRMLQPGDLVALVNRVVYRIWFERVLRATKTQIILANGLKYSKETGRPVARAACSDTLSLVKPNKYMKLQKHAEILEKWLHVTASRVARMSLKREEVDEQFIEMVSRWRREAEGFVKGDGDAGSHV